MIRRHGSMSGEEADNAREWPIALWRPKSPPTIPLHKRVLSLISPTPLLEHVVPISRVPLQPHAMSQPQFPLPPSRTGSGRRRRSEQQRAMGQGLDVLVEDGEYSPRNRRHRLSASSRASSVPLTPETLKHPEVEARHQSVRSSLLTPPSSSSHQSPRSPAVPPLVQTAQHSNTPSRQPTPDPLAQARIHILHLYRMLHCLNLARQLLETYNLLANSALRSASFPPSVMREWEADMDEWWTESSGVLNAAYQRAKAILAEKEGEWQDLVRQGGKDVWKEKRGLCSDWKRETKPRWDLPRLRRGSAESAKSSANRVPGWVIDIVTEPFGPDEIEEEVWRLEVEGTVPSGTFQRMFGKGDGIPHGEFGDLTPRQVDEAARLGLREIDLDEKQRREREAWREGNDRAKRWSMFV